MGQPLDIRSGCKANLCDDQDDKWICPDCGWTAAMLVDVVVAEQEHEG